MCPFCEHAACTVDFEHMNYTVITSQCKGPNYSADRCCVPLKQLLCPVHEQFNDRTTTCPETFFSYVNLYGRYPPGLFASLCREGEEGLDCSTILADPPEQHNGARPASRLIMLFSGLALLAIFNMS
ncbi:GPI-anchored protein LLG1 [Sesamum alatum]|uniref:GPI-anchored protein LLG1 n=1 Tax=Sesamum alatum TaxID=300844 RepID=A0AAE1Y0A7_9LAMI|nr:GPI-anchored protein LLG1 [Sesamum alatum]